jgi:AraC-like DNA-binding protein
MSLAAIPFAWMERHTAGAVRKGVSLDTLLAECLIDLPHGDQSDVISPAQAILMCLTTALAVEDAAHGLARTTLATSSSSIGLRMALGCSTLEGAIHALTRLYGLASPVMHIQLRTDGGMAILSVHTEGTDDRDLAYLEEVFLMWLFIEILIFLGRPPPILKVTVRDPFHFNLGRSHWCLRAPVRHGGVTAFHFPKKLLAEPPVSRAGDNVMWDCHALLFDYLDGSLASRPAARHSEVTGFVRFSDIVRESGVSPNTVRRHLQAGSGGYREVRQRALVDAASAHLAASDESIDTIAAALGYSEASSLRRFLKSATGLTPQQVRDRQRAKDARVDDQVLLRIKAISEKWNV